jgi:hypothetical protein
MPLITLEKTWAFAQRRLGTYGTVGERMADTFVVFKNVLVDAGWVVQSSSDGTFTGPAMPMRPADLWDNWGAIDWGDAPAAHSWIVLRNAAIAPAFEVCLEVTATSTNWNFHTCPAGYNTDGTVNARPTPITATREYSTTAVIVQAANYGTINCLYSTDGTCTRVFTANGGGHSYMCQEATNINHYGGYFSWEVPSVPATWWRVPRWVHIWSRSYGSGSSGIAWDPLGSTARQGLALSSGSVGNAGTVAEANGRIYAIGLSTIGAERAPTQGGATSYHRWLGHNNSQGASTIGINRSGEYTVSPFYLLTDQPNGGEVLGQLYDMYACDPWLPSGVRWRDATGSLRMLTVGCAMLGCPAQRIRL